MPRAKPKEKVQDEMEKSVDMKPKRTSARNRSTKGLENSSGDKEVKSRKGAKKMKCDSTPIQLQVQDDINTNKEYLEDEDEEVKCEKSGPKTKKLSRLRSLRAKVETTAPGEYFFEADIKGGAQDLEDNGKEVTTDGNVCVSPDQADNGKDPSPDERSPKTGEGKKDVWETIVNTTRKDPRAQKLSYQKIKIDEKGSEKSDTCLQPSGESGVSVTSTVSGDSDGHFTGIRTYSRTRRRLSAQKKNNNGADKSMEEISSRQGNNDLTVVNKAEESKVRGGVEKTSEEVVGKRAVRSRKKAGAKPRDVNVVDNNDIGDLENLGVVREAVTVLPVGNSDDIENSEELVNILDGPEVERLSAEAKETEAYNHHQKTTKKSGKSKTKGKKVEAEVEEALPTEDACLDKMEVEESAEVKETEGKHQKKTTKKSGRSKMTGKKVEADVEEALPTEDACLDKMEVEESAEVKETEVNHQQKKTAKKSGRSKTTGKKMEAEVEEALPIGDACLDKLEVKKSAGVKETEGKHQNKTAKKSGRSKTTGKKVEADVEEALPTEDACLETMEVEESAEVKETEDKHQTIRKSFRSRKAEARQEDAPLVEDVDEMNVPESMKAAGTESSLSLGIENTRTGGRSRRGEKKSETELNILPPIDHTCTCVDRMDVQEAAATAEETVIKTSHLHRNDTKSESSNPVPSNCSGEVVTALVDYLASTEKQLENFDLSLADDIIDDGVLETGAIDLLGSCPDGEGREKEGGRPGRKTGKKTNTESEETKVIKDATPRLEEQTEEIEMPVSDVKAVPSDCAETARTSGRSRRNGKNAARENVDAPSGLGEQESKSELKSLPTVSEMEVAVMNNGPSAGEEIVRKSGRRRKKAGDLKDADNFPGKQIESTGMDTESAEQVDTDQTELIAAVTVNEGTVGRSRKNTRQSSKKQEAVNTAQDMKKSNNNLQLVELKSTPSDEIIDVVKDAPVGQDGEIKATAGSDRPESISVAEDECSPSNGEDNVRKGDRARRKPKKSLEELADAVTLPPKEVDEQEKALVKSCPPGEDVRKSRRLRKNDRNEKEDVEETAQVLNEHDTEACHQETVEMVASETTRAKSEEDARRSGRMRKKGGEAKETSSSVETKMEGKKAGVDTDQSQTIRKSGRSRKKDGEWEEISLPADSIGKQEGNDIQGAVGVAGSEVTAARRSKRLPKKDVKAKEKTNDMDTCASQKTNVKDFLEATEIEIKKSFCKVVDDNNNNEASKMVVMDVVETVVEKPVEEDPHCKRKGRKNTRQPDNKEPSHLMSVIDDAALDAEKTVAETAGSTVGDSGFYNNTQTFFKKKSVGSSKNSGKAAKVSSKSELLIIEETEEIMSDGVAEEDGKACIATDTSEVVLPEVEQVIPVHNEIPQDKVPALVENLTSDLNQKKSVPSEVEHRIPEGKGGGMGVQRHPAEVQSSGVQSESDVLQVLTVLSSNLVTKVSSVGVAVEIAEKQHIKTEPITPCVQVPVMNIKNEPIIPMVPVLGSLQNVKEEPITPYVPAQQQSVYSAGENQENETIPPNIPIQQLNQELFSSDLVCDQEVERLSDIGLALHGNKKRRIMSKDEASPAKTQKKEYQSGFWNVVDGDGEQAHGSILDATADGLDLNGNAVSGLKSAVEVEADVHAEVDGTTAPVVPRNDGFDSLKRCNKLRNIIGSMATTCLEAVDDIVVEDLPVQAGVRKRGGTRGQATKRKQEEVKEVWKSKRSKKVEDEDSEAGGSGSIEVKPTRCYQLGPSRKKDMYVGAHVSISGGIHKAVANAVEIGARAFGLFLRSQRQWAVKPISDDIVQKFKKACKEHNFPPHLILPHGSYLMNLGSPKQDLLQKSRHLLVEELSRCELLGLELFNFHPGSTIGETSVEDSILKIAESINWAHSKTKYCKTVIENMSCQGHTIGGKFSELRAIIDFVKDKSRIGVCLDTCHAMAAGYDLSTEKGFIHMMDDFTSIIGLEYLVGVHLNDSVGEVGCHKDHHENIGQGKIGRAGFRRIMNDARFSNIPMILETPANIDDVIEIELLYMMCKNK